MTWIEVDREGLQVIFPKKYIVRELVANMWDEYKNGARNGSITLQETAKNLWVITAKDDSPKGFKDLSDSYTMFRYTDKRKDPEVRGRFNSGDKYVLAHSEEAKIISTTGTYIFFEDGSKRFFEDERLDKGSILEFCVQMTEEIIKKIYEDLRYYKSPKNFNLTIDIINYEGEGINFVIPQMKNKIVSRASGNLTTWYVDENDEKKIIPRRNTSVVIYEEDKSFIYEMGIPVQRIDDRFSYDVQQKVPLDQNREMVSEKYLKDVRGVCLVAVSQLLEDNDLSESWVDDALSSNNVDDATFETVTEKKFPNAVFWSTDQLANERAEEDGKQVIHPRTVPKKVRDRMKETGSVPMSTTLFPTTFESANYVSRSDITDSMKRIEAFTKKLARELLSISLVVDFINNPHVSTAAQFGGRIGVHKLTFNVGVLGKGWFNRKLEVILELVLHEFGHYFSQADDKPHRSKSYYDGLSKIGSQCTLLALRNPEIFDLQNY